MVGGCPAATDGLDGFWRSRTIRQREQGHSPAAQDQPYIRWPARLRWLERRLSRASRTDIVDFQVHLDTARRPIDT
jgi:hypothetical protein